MLWRHALVESGASLPRRSPDTAPSEVRQLHFELAVEQDVVDGQASVSRFRLVETRHALSDLREDAEDRDRLQRPGQLREIAAETAVLAEAEDQVYVRIIFEVLLGAEEVRKVFGADFYLVDGLLREACIPQLLFADLVSSAATVSSANSSADRMCLMIFISPGQPFVSCSWCLMVASWLASIAS